MTVMAFGARMGPRLIRPPSQRPKRPRGSTNPPLTFFIIARKVTFSQVSKPPTSVVVLASKSGEPLVSCPFFAPE